MISTFIQFFFGNMRLRNMKRVQPLVNQVNEWCDQYDALTPEELKGKTTEFRARLADGATVDELLPEAFAAFKQACKRLVGESWEAGGIHLTWNDVPFDEQICGAIYMHRGFVTEMATGEGKTLTAGMPLYLNALEGQGAHLVTVNDYLARRDSEWMGKVYETLGMTVGCILTDMDARTSAAWPITATLPTAPTTNSASTTCATTWPGTRSNWSSAAFITRSWTRWIVC